MAVSPNLSAFYDFFNKTNPSLQSAGTDLFRQTLLNSNRLNNGQNTSAFPNAPLLPNKINSGQNFDIYNEKLQNLPKAVYKPVQGLDRGYFDSLRESRKSQLRDEFFGPGGQFEQASSNESAAGRLGSGVGRRILSQTVTEPFTQAYTGIDRDIDQQYLQELARTQELNAQNQMQTDQYNADLDYKANVLASQLANAQTEEELNRIQQQIDLFEAQTRAAGIQGQLSLDYQNQIFNQNQVNPTRADPYSRTGFSGPNQEYLGVANYNANGTVTDRFGRPLIVGADGKLYSLPGQGFY